MSNMRGCTWVFLSVLLTFACAETARPAVEPQPAPEPSRSEPPSNPNEEEPVSHEPESASNPEGPPSPPQSATSPEREETRTLERIQALVAAQRKPVRACYDRLRREHPEIGDGQLTIQFVLDPRGKIRSAVVNAARSTLRDQELTACAIERLKTIPFPPSSRGMDTTVNYPYVFKR